MCAVKNMSAIASVGLGLAAACLAAIAADKPAAQAGRAAARVVIVHDPRATDAFRAREERVRQMVARGVMAFTGRASVSNAWASLVSPRDLVGIKVHAAPGAYSGTRPAVVAVVVEGLLAAGVPATRIVVWDKELADLRLAGYFELADRFGVRVTAVAATGYDEKQFYDTPLLGKLVHGDREFGKTGEGVGRKSFVSRLVSRELTRIINVTPLLNHNEAGVSGNLVTLALASVDNTLRFQSDPARLEVAVPEIYALPLLGDRVALNIVDALVCQYEGGERGLLHYSTALNELRFSVDPVALDVLSLRELERQRQGDPPAPAARFLELYRNAALLEIGQSDFRAVRVERLQSDGGNE
jgi:hypothetical protein